MVEWIWVEINARVNYPIKEMLAQMLENGEFDLDDECNSIYQTHVLASLPIFV